MKLTQVQDKVEKLLRQAADREGTPEGDSFRDKAFELMAQYGVEASREAAEDKTSHTADQQVNFAGTYTDMQFELLNTLAHALHCQVVRLKLRRSTKVHQAFVFGRDHHIERVMMLHTLLSGHMIVGASKAPPTCGFAHTSPQTQKRSWMRGFIHSVGSRLEAIEMKHAPQFESQTSAARGVVALQDDRKQAYAAAREKFPGLKTDLSQGRPRTFDPFSYQAGVQAGAGMDLGQQRVQRGVRALGRGRAV
ncbi:DUF2786 domain-containing protein [Corynebacterium heidelbergense]|uniref:Uncharacterized protein n=1 Tax=Corynebacterium heidelbergense TaxID=2055947 RepID=A0A364VDE5_9CORY|nr:DUF2786 domain-containing protein [Corynebacterium heidelbergense]RAV34663.1 hypothetical protein CWC39_01930 [Corynebacterium heidelbergense]WCZ36235.1 hypothetical protein CHEID_03400 [Corynebacterium heidelbergense]